MITLVTQSENALLIKGNGNAHKHKANSAVFTNEDIQDIKIFASEKEMNNYVKKNGIIEETNGDDDI